MVSGKGQTPISFQELMQDVPHTIMNIHNAVVSQLSKLCATRTISWDK